jgi:urocanate hydratase
VRDEAFRCYRALLLEAGGAGYLTADNSEPNLGGKLLFAGDLDGPGCSMVIAGNIAGCATLAATAVLSTQKQSIREGIVDFVVNSLDEALRILKNEIRKKSAVAVCVTAAPDAVEREMIERGVLPDLVFSGQRSERPHVSTFGAHRIELTEPYLDPALAFISWQAPRSAGRWMPKLDAIVLECLSSDGWAKRWIRLSSRYRGRNLANQRALYCDPETAKRIADHISSAVSEGQIATEVSICLTDDGEEPRVFHVAPEAGNP